MFVTATLDNLVGFMEAVNQLCNLLNTEKVLFHFDEVTCHVKSIRNTENKLGLFLESHTLVVVARESG